MKQEYFTPANKTVEPRYGEIVRELQSLNTFITFRDTGDTHVYDYEAGTYKPDAMECVEGHLLRMLEEQFKKRIADEVKYQLKISTYVNREDFEPPENLILVKNGILDVYTGELNPFSPVLYFEKGLDVEYNPEEKGTWWKQFINELICPKMRELQKFAGYLLLNSARYKKGLLLLGDTDTGKSTYSTGICGVIGKENICGVSIQDLDRRFQKTRLYKKTLNYVGDLRSTSFKHVEVFNMTTGGDFIEGEIKGSTKTRQFTWTGKHWFTANKLPSVSGDADSDAFYNRLCIVTFPYQIPKDKIIKDFDEKLQDEKEKSAILNWMLDGLDLLLKEGFEDVDIEKIRDFYKRASDTVYCFAEDMCVLEPDSYVKRTDAYNAYSDYCIKRGLPSVGRNTFYDKIPNHIPGVSVDRSKTGYGFKNLKIIIEDTQEEEGVNIVNYFSIPYAQGDEKLEYIYEKNIQYLHQHQETTEKNPENSLFSEATRGESTSIMGKRIEEAYHLMDHGQSVTIEEGAEELGIPAEGIKGLFAVLEREGRIHQQPPGYYRQT